MKLPIATPSPDQDPAAVMATFPTAKVPPPSRTVSMSSGSSFSENDNPNTLAFTPGAKESNRTNVVEVDQEEPQVRRSTRDKKSTLVYIGGQAVLAKNNYKLKGLSYEYGTDFTTQKSQAPPKAKSKQVSKPPPPPRTPTALETKRRKHNDQVKHRIESKQNARFAFLSKNISIMEPFLDEAVAANFGGDARSKLMKNPIGIKVRKFFEGYGFFTGQVTSFDGYHFRVTFEDGDVEDYTAKELAKIAVPNSEVDTKLPSSSAKANSTSNETGDKLYPQPYAIQAELRDYQLAGLNWMIKMHRRNLGMILGDEMGLGKTLQTIALLCHLKEHEGINGPSLVIAPLSVLYSWCTELERWAPSLKFLRFHASSTEERETQRLAFIERATEYDVVVTTYEMAKAPGLRSLWSRQYFNYLVLDEGHRIKDATNQISQAVRLIHSENVLILTGTPIQNNLVELWSLLNFLYPEVFDSSEPFAEAFDVSLNIVKKDKLLQAHHLLGLFMIRRLKSEVEKLMPKKVETKVLCPLSNTQVWWYKALLMKDINLLARTSADDDDSPRPTTAKALNNLVVQLRKCCLHPFLFDGAEVDFDSTTCEDLIAASGKLAVLDMLLRSLYENKHRVVLFSQFTRVLDILDDYCTMRGWKHCRFDGSTARAKRNFTVNQFNAPNSEYFVFLMSTRSGGMGLNLQSADTVILFDSDWNPQPDIQAAARVHRIGQQSIVHVYRLVCGGTIEERMIERAEKKLFLDQCVNQDSSSSAGGIDSEEERLSKEELLSTLKFGCDAVFGDNENQNYLPSEDEIRVITDRNRSIAFSDGKLKGGATKIASDFDADAELVATTKLGGIDFAQIRDEFKKKKTRNSSNPKDLGDIAWMWSKLQKRHRKSRIVNVEAEGSGYGSKCVPVLVANNYDLAHGESSIVQRELGYRKENFGEIKRIVKRSGVDFAEQNFCQVCGDGGLLLCCPRCPVCVHKECVGVRDPKNFLSCPHHRCSTCGKNNSAAGGFLFPCQSCPHSFCEDCLPVNNKGFRFLGSCERFVKMGFDSKHVCYIHCSEQCESVAKQEFRWSLSSAKRSPTPTALDLSQSFGSQIDATIEEPEETCESRLRKRKPVNYAAVDTAPSNRNVKSRSDEDSAWIPSPSMSYVTPGKAKMDCTKPAPHSLPARPTFSNPSNVNLFDAIANETPTSHLSVPPPSNRQYDVVFPVTPHGLQLKVASLNEVTVFGGYVSNPDGSKGPAQRANRVRNLGDRIIAVNHVNTRKMAFSQVLDTLRSSKRQRKTVKIRFKERPSRKTVSTTGFSNTSSGEQSSETAKYSTGKETTPTVAFQQPADRPGIGIDCDAVKQMWFRAEANETAFTSGKYSTARVKARTSLDGRVVPVSKPRKKQDGSFVQPAGHPRKGMNWDAAKGVWVPAPQVDETERIWWRMVSLR